MSHDNEHEIQAPHLGLGKVLHEPDMGTGLSASIYTRWNNLRTKQYSAEKLSKLLQKTAREIKTLQPKALRKKAAAFVRESYHLWQAQAEKLYGVSSRKGGFSMDNIALNLWAKNTLDIPPDEGLIDRVIKIMNPSELLDREEAKSDRRIVKLFLFYARTELIPPQDFMDRWEKAILEDLQYAVYGEGRFNPTQITNLLWSYAKLAIEPPKNMITLLSNVIEKEHANFSGTETAKCLWSCAVLNSITTQSRYRDMGRAFYQHEELDISRDKNLRRVTFACLWFDFTPPPIPLPPETDKKSPAEEILKSGMRSAGISVREDKEAVRTLNTRADIGFVLDEMTVRAQHQGKVHFLRQVGDGEITRDRYTGRTRFNLALMYKLTKETVVSIPDKTAFAIKANPSRTVELLQDLAKQIRTAPIGVYDTIVSKDNKGQHALELKPFTINPLRNLA